MGGRDSDLDGRTGQRPRWADGTAAGAGDWRGRRGGNEIRVGSAEMQQLSQAFISPNSQAQGTWTLDGPPEGNPASAEKQGLGVRDGEQCH